MAPSLNPARHQPRQLRRPFHATRRSSPARGYDVQRLLKPPSLRRATRKAVGIRAMCLVRKNTDSRHPCQWVQVNTLITTVASAEAFSQLLFHPSSPNAQPQQTRPDWEKRTRQNATSNNTRTEGNGCIKGSFTCRTSKGQISVIIPDFCKGN